MEKKHVLVVEDEPSILQFWQRFLDELNLSEHVILLDDKAARELLTHKKYDLVVCDIILPHQTGFELAELARKKNPHTQVILTTAYGADLSRFRPKEQKFHLLQKPFSNLDELKNLIVSLLNDQDVFAEASEDSFSHDEDYPEVTRWSF